jgi:CelD/BcsL family acetyltransferase involved in cellulose biosynthesis
MIQCEIVHGDDILEYREIWNELFDSDEYEASTSFEWTNALLKTELKEKDTFLLMLLKNSEEIVGIVPLIVSEKRKYGFSLITIFPISEYYNTHSDILLKNISEELVKILITSIYRLDYRWDIFRMRRFVEDSIIIDHIESYLKKASIKYEIRRTEPSFFITLASDYSEYLKKRSGKFRNYLRRMEKKLNAIGHVEISKLNNYDSISDAYKQLLYVEEKSWKHKHGTAISSIKKQEDFYRELCEEAIKRGWLHLIFLYLNNEPIAYNIGLIKDKKYLYLKTSFDEDFRKLGPATLLRAKLIEELIINGVKYFDFPGEPYEWERQWTDELQWHKSLLIYNNTFKAKLFSIYNAVKKIIPQSSDENQFQYHNPRDLKPDNTK